ncbi:alpha-D-ribose 1-methylphosphonate 5-triphosphate diphosphatase [Sulfitobacter sp. HNIBRBA2951]|uniref:alpha-D-ribose 1-methylphosphonate 5-triphosphate diphosphatase n=1 Tax=Sulfitobacter aquimarinus TaxID=3158557 RepID=UPI0032DFA752
MTEQIIFANAKLILENEVIHGALCMRGGVIEDISIGRAVPRGARDMEGDYLAPGLVEVHTDNLERHLEPRAKVIWPYRAAILAHDRELAGTGITTVFDAIRVGSILSHANAGYGQYARRMVDEIRAMRDLGVLRITHRIHLRAETCSETLIEEFAEFDAGDDIGIVSMMDHTPGQRQFTDMAKFETYIRGKRKFTDAQFRDYVDFLYGLQDRLGVRHVKATIEAARRLGAVLASHDDTTPAQVAASHANGVTLAEFPTTVAAADACHAHGIATIMGVPNLVRGASHSGNVAAAELAQRDRLDILSSDYVPAGLLMAAVQLGRMWGDVARGMATVTAHPAQAVGLTDRGRLAAGLRADLIRFGVHEGTAILRETWCAGQRV